MRVVWSVVGLCLFLAWALPLQAEERRCDHDATVCLKYIIDNLEGKGWLGVELKYAESGSPEIVKVIEGGPAESAGVEAGDLMMALNGARYDSATDEALREAKKSLLPGNRVTLTLERGGSEIEVEVVAAAVPESVLAQWIGNHLLYQHRHQVADTDGD